MPKCAGFWAVGLLSVAVVLVPGCGSKGAQGQQCANGNDAGLNGTIQSAMVGGGCGGLTGAVAIGQPCKSGGDCAPACCDCGSLASGKSASVGYCEQGVCATANDTCCA